MLRMSNGEGVTDSTEESLRFSFGWLSLYGGGYLPILLLFCFKSMLFQDIDQIHIQNPIHCIIKCPNQNR